MEQQRGQFLSGFHITDMPRWTGFTGKTLWDWFELLLVPFVLATVAFGLNYFANERDHRREDRLAAREQALADDGKQEDALRGYLQQMSSLMSERSLRSSSPGSEVQAVARVFTLTVLRRLDPERKGWVVRFLAQAGLIGSEVPAPEGVDQTPKRLPAEMPPPKVDLRGANLRDVTLPYAELPAKSFEGADLRGADFRGAHLEATKFDDADLRGANFHEASFLLSDFAGRPTSFDNACLTRARFVRANLFGVDFGLASGKNIDFSGARLYEADFGQTTFIRPKLDGALLRGPRDWVQTAGGTQVTPILCTQQKRPLP